MGIIRTAKDDVGEPIPTSGDETDRLTEGPRGRGRRVAVVLGVVVLLIGGLLASIAFTVSESLGNNIARVPNVFGPLDVGTRPTDQAAPMFLLVSTDSRASAPTTGTDATADEGSVRSDVVMLAPDRSNGSIVSIPRDAWVKFPGRGRGKINAAYAYGGPSLLVQTVEQLTAVRVDHFAVIDFAGFQAMVDAVDGIDVQVAQETSNGGVKFKQGLNHLDGVAALAYVRQRYDLPGGDMDRARRQQNALRALLGQAASSGTLRDPIKLVRFLDATSRSIGVDDTLSNSGSARWPSSRGGCGRPASPSPALPSVASDARTISRSYTSTTPAQAACGTRCAPARQVNTRIRTQPTLSITRRPDRYLRCSGISRARITLLC